MVCSIKLYPAHCPQMRAGDGRSVKEVVAFCASDVLFGFVWGVFLRHKQILQDNRHEDGFERGFC